MFSVWFAITGVIYHVNRVSRRWYRASGQRSVGTPALLSRETPPITSSGSKPASPAIGIQ